MRRPLIDCVCVLSSSLDIVHRAVNLQVAQLARKPRVAAPTGLASRSPVGHDPALHIEHVPSARESFVTSPAALKANPTTPLGQSRTHGVLEAYIGDAQGNIVRDVSDPPISDGSEPTQSLMPSVSDDHHDMTNDARSNSLDAHEDPVMPSGGSAMPSKGIDAEASREPSVVLRASRVPSSRIGRLFHYGGLAAGLGIGAASELLRRAGTGDGSQTPLLLSGTNISRLVDKLSKMRGAALKLGQFMSIQDAHILPPQLEMVFQQLQNKADYMPNWQMERVMSTELGVDWKSNFVDFNPIPNASASIGQFPNVAESISSDLSNLSLLLASSALLPRGLFLGNTIKVMREELADECDYVREADSIERFGELLGTDTAFAVPRVVKELSTKRVLVMERMQGVPLTNAVHFDQLTKNEISSKILALCLRELFQFRLMQTDPNWTNFLWNAATRKIELIDFGATREYRKDFIDDWLRLLRAAIAGHEQDCLDASRAVGYLTGDENQAMLTAHVESMFLLSIPFRSSSPQPYRFADQLITSQIRALIPVMLRNRLTPPPRETYSLNRKLSGAFLLCARLGAVVPCSDIWTRTTSLYQYD